MAIQFHIRFALFTVQLLSRWLILHPQHANSWCFPNACISIAASDRKRQIFLFNLGFLPTFGPSFINLYGSPREFSDGPDKFDALNLAKGEGCAYRGRVLCEVQTELLDEMQQSGVNPMPEDMKVHVTVSDFTTFSNSVAIRFQKSKDSYSFHNRVIRLLAYSAKHLCVNCSFRC